MNSGKAVFRQLLQFRLLPLMVRKTSGRLVYFTVFCYSDHSIAITIKSKSDICIMFDYRLLQLFRMYCSTLIINIFARGLIINCNHVGTKFSEDCGRNKRCCSMRTIKNNFFCV